MTLSGDVPALRFTADGLIPAIVQDVATREVLMMGWMNRESLRLTIESGQVWFWSRSRQELWHKGASSGHTQQVVKLSYDCDGDTLLVEVHPAGPACHTGETSCFFNTVIGGSAAAAETSAPRLSIITELIDTIDKRFIERPAGAYTTYLFDKGTDKIVKKIGEEATEVVVAAKNRDANELVCEASDLFYHTLVLLRNEGVSFSDVLGELERRHGTADVRGKTK
ncbi:MAG: bifunctional phosphoribosyl-AMP cyclohydrolase/phosphoribosyl-ATP pyrophosphatase [Bacilli bacterium]|nr:bifunctional phosphoribosyl-AMP cyclohydrolase/phosphoribosyl-ATP pyrophosphatase [Bacilli bacterium]